MIFSHPTNGSLTLSIKGKKGVEASGKESARWELSKSWQLEGLIDKESPLFFEWQQIEIFWEGKNVSDFAAPFQFLLNRQPVKLTSRENEASHQLFGTISLGDSVGYTDMMLVDARGQELFLLKTEVFPQKLNYKSDFDSMVTEITDIIYQLAFSHLQKTYAITTPHTVPKQTLNEWMTLLEGLYETLEQSLDNLLRRPHREVQISTVIKPAHQVRKVDKNLEKWLAKHPQMLSRSAKEGLKADEGIFATHLPETSKQISFDTYENRFVAWAIKQILRQLESATQVLSERVAQSEKLVYRQARFHRMQQRLRARLQTSFLARMEAFEPQSKLSTTLTMGYGYREFYRSYLLLQKGLRISEADIFQLDYKHISLLYEYWSFLKTLQLIWEDPAYELISQDLIQLSPNRLTINLRKGKTSRVQFQKIATGERISLWYNRAFGRKETHTFTQIPDQLIEFEKAGFEQPFRYVIDAKYQLESEGKDARTGRKNYGPPIAAIGQLHRYRDAILSNKSQYLTYTSAMKSLGGAILFPYPNAESDFENHSLYASLKEVAIGAIPLHPGENRSHQLYKKFLRELFDSSPEALYEQVVEYEKQDHKELIEAINSRVMIGLIPHDRHYAKRKSFFLSKNIYYTRWQKNVEMPEYIALYDGKLKQIIGYAPIGKYAFLIPEELKKIGTKWPHRFDKYMCFQWENWQECTLPFSGMRRAAKRYTSRYGLQMAIHHQSEGCLWLRSYAWVRMWQEINKICENFIIQPLKSDAIQIEFNWKTKAYVCSKSPDDSSLFLINDSSRGSFSTNPAEFHAKMKERN